MKFTDIFDLYHVDYKTEGKHTRPGWIQLDCPYCAGSPYMGINIYGKYANCWRCGRKWIVEVIAKLTGETFKKSKELIGELVSEIPTETKPQGKLEIPLGIGELLPAHIHYLEEVRGFDAKEIERIWEIKGIGNHSSLAWRIWVPFIFQGRVVSWLTRSLMNSGDRYRSASEKQEELPHKTLLYGEDYARHAIAVCEGPLDVWKIGPGAVATCGVGYSPAQLNKMVQFPSRVVCFDSEPEAQIRARRLCTSLSMFPGETVNVVLDSKDPGEAAEREILQVRKLIQIA
jgi:hypothetical protein